MNMSNKLDHLTLCPKTKNKMIYRADILIGTAIILEKIIKSITLDLSMKPSHIRKGHMAMEQA
jgi:hypothetical protein